MSKGKNMQTKKGFTLIELSITMIFVSTLLISVAVIVSNMLSVMQKGLTIKVVNSVGRGLVDEVTSAIRSAPSVDTRSLCNLYVNDDNRSRCSGSGAEGNAYNFVFQDYRSDDDTKQYGGMFCTGKYSYLWNTHYGIDEEHTLSLTYLDMDGNQQVVSTSENPTRLMRIEDSTYRLCSAMLDQNYNSTITSNNTNINITQLANTGMENRIEDPVEGSLDEFDLTLALYELTVFPVSQDSVTYRTYMSATFILGTLRGDIDISRTGDYCSLNTEDDATSIFSLGSEFNYCALNKFNLSARTAGT